MAEVSPFAITLGLTLAIMGLLWLLSLRLKDVSIIDIYWGPGFAVIALAALAMAPAPDSRAWLIVLLLILWGCRLGFHLFTRARGKGEDPRYAAMRRARGPGFAVASLWLVFGFQALIMWFVALPAQLAILAPAAPGLGLLDGIGALMALTGLALETMADRQLTAFRADPANRELVMDRGLWAYSRHPNYFGDTLFQWGVFVVAARAPGAIWAFLCPLVMTWLIIRVSGAALLEKGLTNRRPGYAAYVARTSAFIPWPPKP